jgi:hypothetical protein
MYSEFKAQSTQTFAVRKKPNDQHTFPNPSLAADGFNIWWQKTIAQNMAMVTEASDAHACAPSSQFGTPAIAPGKPIDHQFLLRGAQHIQSSPKASQLHQNSCDSYRQKPIVP